MASVWRPFEASAILFDVFATGSDNAQTRRGEQVPGRVRRSIPILSPATPAAAIARIAGAAAGAVVHGRVPRRLGVLAIAEPVVPATGAGVFTVKAAAGAGWAEAGTVGEGRAGTRSVAVVTAFLHPFTHPFAQLRVILDELPHPFPQGLAALMVLPEPIVQVLDPVADILASVADIFTPVADVLAPVANATVSMGVAYILSPVQHVLAPVASILPAIETVLGAVPRRAAAIEAPRATAAAATRGHRIRRQYRRRQCRRHERGQELHGTSSKKWSSNVCLIQ
jgi:hypothetical protein